VGAWLNRISIDCLVDCDALNTVFLLVFHLLKPKLRDLFGCTVGIVFDHLPLSSHAPPFFRLSAYVFLLSSFSASKELVWMICIFCNWSLSLLLVCTIIFTFLTCLEKIQSFRRTSLQDKRNLSSLIILPLL